MNPEDVQSFYERMPYPAPLTSLDKHIEVFKSPEQRRIRSLQMFPRGNRGAVSKFLWRVAEHHRRRGSPCVSRTHTSRRSTSARTSLGHLRALQNNYSLENLELRQLSILDVSSLEQTFDQIICTGVLHHLPDPDQGLRSLREVLSPDGAMQIMVYASYGRAGIYMMQEYCRLLGIKPTRRELESLSVALKYLSNDHPLAPLLHKVKDFSQPDALADALLHPQDRAYTVPQLYEWLDRCGISFGRWLEQAPYLPQCGVVAKTPHAARITALSEPEQHAAVELFRGAMTQHSFVAYRNDRAKAAQPVRFTGEQWRTYVPVRMPWTRTVRERLPAGAAAVLLNPVHKQSDLFLPITNSEESLHAKIDGKRTLGEIERSITKRKTAELTPAFFKKLWEHDLIVIDASGVRVESVGGENSSMSFNGELV